MSFDRVYRMSRIRTVWLLRGFVTLVGIVLVLCVVTNQGGAFGLVVCGVGLVALCVTSVRSERSWAKVGIYEDLDGLEVVGLGIAGGARTQQRFAWARIDQFRVATHRAKGSVWVVLTDGNAVRLMGVKQGIPIRSGDGETRDIAGVLNRRLADWRASRLGLTDH